MYNLNSVLIEGAVGSVTKEGAVTKLILKTVSRHGAGMCLVEVSNSDKVMIRRLAALSEGQTVRVVGMMKFSEVDGTCSCIAAENIEARPMKMNVPVP